MERDLKTVTILLRSGHTLAEIIKDDVQSHGLSLSEFMVMEALYHKGSLTVNQVIQKILIPNSSLSYVIEQLKTKGLITKKRDKIDRRVYHLNLTSSGHQFISQIYPIHQQILRERLNRLTHDEEMMLQTLLKRIGKDEE